MGWLVDRPGTYYRCRCQCGGKHTVRMHLTPSNPNHGVDRVRQCRRLCERGDQ